MNAKTFLTVDEVAEFLRVHPQTIRRAIHAERLAATKVGHQYRISMLELERFLAEGHVTPKVAGRSPFEPSFNDLLAGERPTVEISAAGGAGAGGGASLLVGINEHFDAIVDELRRAGFEDALADVEEARDRVARKVSGVV